MIPPGRRLTTDEIVSRISRWKAGAPPSVLDPIVASVSALVESVALVYQRRSRGMPLEDLVSEGMFGVSQAIHTFDDAKGSSFPTWAFYSIVGRMKIFVWKESFRVYVPHKCRQIRLPDLLQLDETAEGIDLLSSILGIKKEALVAYSHTRVSSWEENIRANSPDTTIC